MGYAPFTGPALKIQRSAYHRRALDEALKAFAKTMPYNIGPAPDGTRHWAVNLTRSFPDDVPLILGDAIHNLRAALDIAACDAVRTNGKSTDKVKFPFAATAEQLEELLSKEIKKAGPDVVEVIRSYKPFIGGHRDLRGLHDLDIADKHQLILPVDVSPKMTHTRIEAPGMNLTFINSTFRNVRYLSPSGPMKVTHEKPMEPHFSFGPETPFDGEPVIEVLERLAKLADNLVKALAAASGAGNLES